MKKEKQYFIWVIFHFSFFMPFLFILPYYSSYLLLFFQKYGDFFSAYIIYTSQTPTCLMCVRKHLLPVAFIISVGACCWLTCHRIITLLGEFRPLTCKIAKWYFSLTRLPFLILPLPLSHIHTTSLMPHSPYCLHYYIPCAYHYLPAIA